MATTPVIVDGLPTGISGMTLQLYAAPTSGDSDPSIANGAGDTLSEQNCPGFYKAVVDESLVGLYRGIVLSGGVIMSQGWFQLEDTTVPVYDSVGKIAAVAGMITFGTVDTITNTHTPSATEFQCDDITEATANHFNDRLAVFISGNLIREAKTITGYSNEGGIGQFTTNAFTGAPSNDDRLVIV